jgi:LppX_LprAFG lipoprotein
MTARPSVAFMLGAIVVATLAACGGQSAPQLTDPTAIVTAALKSTDAASSVHVDATVDGEVPISIPGLGGGGPVDLTGTTAQADLDLAGSAAHATFLVPALFNLSGDLIATGGKGYLKTTLTGDQYQVVDLSTMPVDVSNAHGLVDQLGDALLSGKLTLTKGADVSCGSGQCYTVTTDVTGQQLQTLLPGTALPVDLSNTTATIQLTVEQGAPNHLHGVRIEATPATGGNPTVIGLTFSDWGKPVTITAPPADQVQGG